MSEGGGKDGARKIPSLMLKLKEKGIEIMDLDVRADVPINFILPSGAIGSGYDATIDLASWLRSSFFFIR